QLPWPYLTHKHFRSSRKPCGKQDCIRLVSSQFAECTVANAAIAKDFATLKFQISQRCELLCPVLNKGRDPNKQEEYSAVKSPHGSRFYNAVSNGRSKTG